MNAENANFSNAETSAGRSPRISPKVTKYIGLTAAAANVLSMTVHGISAIENMSTDQVVVANELPSVDPRGLIKDTKVIKIEHAAGAGESVRYTDGHIRQAIRSAGLVLEGLSHDELTLPDEVDIHTIKLTPDGLYTNDTNHESVECYSDEQLDRVQTQYLKNSDLPAATSLATVINQGDSCVMLNAGAVGVVDYINGMPIGTQYGAVLTDNLVLHEVGHVLGLGHAASLNCDSPNASSLLEQSAVDIGELIESGCVVPKRGETDKLDMYSDHATVMGGILAESIDSYTERFNSNETTKLAPEVAKNKDISLEAATYELSTLYEETRAITLMLPADHPLRKIDPKIDKLTIGLMSQEFGGAPNATVQVIAHHEEQSYRLTHSFPYIAGYDDQLGPIEVYHDETLGVKAIIHPGSDPRSVKVAIEHTK